MTEQTEQVKEPTIASPMPKKKPLVERARALLKTGAGEPTAIRLPEDLREKVDSIAQDEGKTFGEICRELIEDGVKSNPDRQRQVLLRSVAITTAQFEKALELGVLKGTEAEEQADDIRRFFGQLAGVLKGQEKN